MSFQLIILGWATGITNQRVKRCIRYRLQHPCTSTCKKYVETSVFKLSRLTFFNFIFQAQVQINIKNLKILHLNAVSAFFTKLFKALFISVSVKVTLDFHWQSGAPPAAGSKSKSCKNQTNPSGFQFFYKTVGGFSVL